MACCNLALRQDFHVWGALWPGRGFWSGHPWPGKRGPWPGGPLAPGGPWPRGVWGGPWPGGPLARGALGSGLAWGAWPKKPLPGGAPWPLVRGALGPGGPWPGGPKILSKSPKITKLSNQPAWTLASLLVQESSYQGPGGPRGGGPTNPEPKTLNRPPRQRETIWGYTLATLKVVWVPAIP